VSRSGILSRVAEAFTLLLAIALLGGCVRDAVLATWNIRILSDNSRDDDELALIADVIGRYDFVAVQEARDTAVLDRLVAILPGYSYLASAPVGRSVREIYAFLYRSDVVEPVGEASLYPDPDDMFIREPYVAGFRVGRFDFTVVSIHLLYGDSIGERREELRLLDDVVAWVDEQNGDESDILLMGDFNFPASDAGWELDGWEFLVSPDSMTTITDTSSYDNVVYRHEYTGELAGLYEIYAFDEFVFRNDDDAASLAVSDHRPVAALFRISPLADDD